MEEINRHYFNRQLCARWTVKIKELDMMSCQDRVLLLLKRCVIGRIEVDKTIQ